ncbi:hypothetical protein VTH06DRAFT_5499 [Thermothelomyces fergusii]
MSQSSDRGWWLLVTKENLGMVRYQPVPVAGDMG